MSNDVADLQEFNSRVSQSLGSEDSNRPVRGYVGDDYETKDDSPKSGVVTDMQMWAVYGGRNYSACEKAVPEIPPGQYTVEQSNQLGIYFSRTTVTLDELIALPDSVSEQVISDIELFWEKEEHFRKFGFMWKRGVLLWGPPGSGKTSTLQVIADRVIQRGGIAIYVDHPGVAAKGLKQLRGVEPDRPLIVMLEDIDAIIDNYGESDLLALMDGELQIDNVVFVATTNYPERLDKRFINRPSRFDIVKKIGMPNEVARETYLRSKCTRLDGDDFQAKDELRQWVDATKGFSIAHMKELIVSVEVFGVDISTASQRLRTMMDVQPKSSDAEREEGTSFGFA